MRDDIQIQQAAIAPAIDLKTSAIKPLRKGWDGQLQFAWEDGGGFAEQRADESPVRVMALHAMLYCERLFYLEEVEEIRGADRRGVSGECVNLRRVRYIAPTT